MSPTSASAPASSVRSLRGEATAIEDPDGLRRRDVLACVADLGRSVGRPVSGAVARELEQDRALLGLAAERALTRREKAGKPEPLEAGPRDRLRIARDEGEPDARRLQPCQSLGGAGAATSIP